MIIKEISSRVLKLIKHKEGAFVVEELYSGFANASEKNLLILDFYGREFSLFKVIFWRIDMIVGKSKGSQGYS